MYTYSYSVTVLKEIPMILIRRQATSKDGGKKTEFNMRAKQEW